MSVREGLRRVNKLGRVLGTTGALLMLFAFTLVLVASRFPNANAGPFALGDFLVLGVGLLLAGVGVATLGWIGEGFAAKDQLE